MFGRLLLVAALLTIPCGVGHALPPEYNKDGRDRDGNTAEQNEAMRLRGSREKELFARENSSREKAESRERLVALIPGGVFLTIVAVAGVVAVRRRQ